MSAGLVVARVRSVALVRRCSSSSRSWALVELRGLSWSFVGDRDLSWAVVDVGGQLWKLVGGRGSWWAVVDVGGRW